MPRARAVRALAAMTVACLAITACGTGSLEQGPEDNGYATPLTGADAEHFVLDEDGVYLCVLRRPTDLAELRARYNPRSVELTAGDPNDGSSLFAQTCQACHGSTAIGVDGLGPALANSGFVTAMSDGDLGAMIVAGRPVDDPGNRTGLPMPPNGGYPYLSQDDVDDLVAFLRSLQS